MDFWEKIDEKLKRINQPHQIQLTPQREILCICNTEDNKSIIEHIGDKLVKEYDEDYQILKKKIEEDEKRLHNYELTNKKEFYLLLVYDKIEQYTKDTSEVLSMLENQKVYRKYTVEGCIISDEVFDFLGNEIREKPLNSGVTWIIDKRGIISISMLLQNAQFGESLLSETAAMKLRERDGNSVWEHSVFAIRTEECNAVREDLCKTLLKAIKDRIEPQKDDIKLKIKNILYSKDIQYKYLQLTPDLTWFPLIGYEKVRSKLNVTIEDVPFWERIIVRLIKEKNYKAEETVGQILIDLYSNKDGIGIEQNRKEYIPKAAAQRSAMIQKSEEFEQILQSLDTKFTIYDVVFTIKDKISALRVECDGKMKEIEGEIEKCLCNDFAFREVNPSGIMDSLDEYNKLFKEYIKTAAEKEWWTQLLTPMEGISKDKSDEYQSLRRKKEILEDYMVSENFTFSFDQQKEVQPYYIDLDSIIKTFSSNAIFDANDLLFIVQERNREYGADINVERSKTPIMFMVVSDDIHIDENTDNICVGWELLKARYLPQWITYQIRIYNLNV